MRSPLSITENSRTTNFKSPEELAFWASENLNGLEFIASRDLEKCEITSVKRNINRGDFFLSLVPNLSEGEDQLFSSPFSPTDELAYLCPKFPEANLSLFRVREPFFQRTSYPSIFVLIFGVDNAIISGSIFGAPSCKERLSGLKIVAFHVQNGQNRE